MKKPRKLFCSLASTIIAIASLTGGTNAAVTAITSGTGAAGDITITLPPINFAATSAFAGGLLALVFDEAQPAGTADYSSFTGPNLGGGNVSTYQMAGSVFGAVTANDPIVATFSALPFSISDTVSFAGGTISMTAPTIGLEVFPSGSYEVFLVDGFGTRLSANGVAVPEPSSSLLVGLATLGFVSRRRRN